jgi:hypothetical protein
LVAFGVVAVASGLATYFLKYKPNPRAIARRVDRLGLEERMVTMMELEGEDSYIANLQRENAKAHLDAASNRKIRFRLSKAVSALALVAFVLSASMTTVAALADKGIIPTLPELNEPDPMESFIAVTYFVEEGGEIEGLTDQLVAPGEDAAPVVAVAQDGWVFVEWDDGVKNPERHDLDVQSEIYVEAIFEDIIDDGNGESDGNEADGNGEGSEEGDSAEDVPGGSNSKVESENQGDAGDEGDASGADGDSDGGKGSGEEEGEGKGEGQGQGAGGKWEDSNQFYDGETYYRDHLDMYYQMALEYFAEHGEIPPELKEFFETYYDSI